MCKLKGTGILQELHNRAVRVVAARCRAFAGTKFPQHLRRPHPCATQFLTPRMSSPMDICLPSSAPSSTPASTPRSPDMPQVRLAVAWARLPSHPSSLQRGCPKWLWPSFLLAHASRKLAIALCITGHLLVRGAVVAGRCLGSGGAVAG
jgi:hypothetical protein